MKTRLKPKPDGEQLELPFLDPEAVPELNEEISSLDNLLADAADFPALDELMASLPSLDDLLAESKANDQALFDEMAKQIQRDIDALLGPEGRRGDAVGPINHIEEGTKP